MLLRKCSTGRWKKDFEMLQKLKEVFEDKISRGYASDSCSSADNHTHKSDVDGKRQMQEPELSEDMMAFAFVMGEYAVQDFYIRYYFLKRKSMEQC